MKFFQAFNKKHGKYLHEMKELFGNWNRRKGPKRVYHTAGHARSAVKNVLYDLPSRRKPFDPDEWEIHELELTVKRREPFKK